MIYDVHICIFDLFWRLLVWGGSQNTQYIYIHTHTQYIYIELVLSLGYG
jgi:hypothetical protein